MQRLLFFIFVVSFFSSSFASKAEELYNKLPKNENGKVCYEEVINLEGKTTEDIYLSAKIFIANSFKSAQDVIQLDSKSVIVCKGNLVVYMGTIVPIQHRVSFTLTIKIKDNFYKYSFSDFTDQVDIIHNWGSIDENPNKYALQYNFFTKLDAEMKRITISLNDSMKSINNDDW